MLLASAMSYVTVRGSTIGMPEIRSASAIDLTGLGKKMNTTYFLSKVTHQYDAGGYLTKFVGQRPKLG
jgi:phage protein D